MKTHCSILLVTFALGWQIDSGSLATAAETAARGARSFTPLILLPSPRLVDSAEEYPGGHYRAIHLLDGVEKTEYSSAGNGTNTFLEVDFGRPTRIAAFRHLDRNDPATVAASELTFTDAAGTVLAVHRVRHVNQRAGDTFSVLSEPVTAQRARWRIAALGPQNYGTVGGAEIAFYTTGEPEALPQRIGVTPKILPWLERGERVPMQRLKVEIRYPYATPAKATVRVSGAAAKPAALQLGTATLEFSVPSVESETSRTITIEVEGRPVAAHTLLQQPARKLTVYILPHSHTDIGYTEIQTAIEEKQVNNLTQGIDYARQTADYPEGARFVWNVEVLWAADLYLRRLGEPQRAAFFEAVQKGQVALNGMYLNELTGLCRPEELVRLFRFSTQLAKPRGVTIDAAMISDVPGYTWGTVPAMAQAGIKYFSVAPNYFDRIGTILREWENKPFYWVGPDGQSKVLVWIPFWGYAMSHRYGKMSQQLVEDFCDGLEKRAYPYDIAYVRWSGHGDNAVPDPAICEFVKEWNAQFAWPKFIISSTSDAFRAFEKRYGASLPQVRGDWTPYWEDGAGSSALETAMNRHSSDRLAQAEALFAMLDPKSYPAAQFQDAWNNVLLYSEHTWGAWCSVSEPERKETKEQWAIKKSYADEADRQSRALLRDAEAAAKTPGEVVPGFDVWNTLSWERTGLVAVPGKFPADRNCIVAGGRFVHSQRLTSGEVVFLAKVIPPFASARYGFGATNQSGQPQNIRSSPNLEGSVRAEGVTLDNGLLRVRLDEKTGGIVELVCRDIDRNLADTSGGEALNDYLYLRGEDLKNLQRNGPVKISLGEKGPLVASLIVESTAPGCRSLRREIRLVAGQDYVEIINTVDKARLEAPSYMAKEGKESVNFAFPFNIPNGQILCDVPFGTFQPEADQMPSACKNWLTVGRWIDVANDDFGVTWVTLDAPLVQIGGLTATLLNSQTDPGVWRKKIDRSQKLYSWAMNNHWGTNYRAYQEGPTVFRFILRPHRRGTPADATRFATAFSHPLLPLPAQHRTRSTPLFRMDSSEVVVTALKPSDDGQALIIRLFGAAGKDAAVTLQWTDSAPRQLWQSDTSEERLRKTEGPIRVPAWGVVTLRADLAE